MGVKNLDYPYLSIKPDIARVLEKSLQGKKLTEEDAVILLEASGQDVLALVAVADCIRNRRAGEKVSYVVNRNINFTNVCRESCGFCGFHRLGMEPDAYLLSPEEVVQKACEAWAMGASEVCIQGGLHPGLPKNYYLRVLEEIKKSVPEIHIHAYSPMEVLFGAERSGVPVEEYLVQLRDSGLGSMPGTAAEILVDEIRSRICPGKMSTASWVKVIKAAHRLGIRTTSTMMYGHIENANHQARHLAVLRDIQEETGGFTEFVPLSFVHAKTKLYQDGVARAGTDGLTELKVHAVARLMLDGYIANIQVSWVKLGKRLAQVCLAAGANDFGGTLFEEKIAAAAGADTPGGMTEEEIVKAIKDTGRTPVKRTTLYEFLD